MGSDVLTDVTAIMMAIVGVAIVATLVLNANNTSALVEDFTTGFANSVKGAEG